MKNSKLLTALCLLTVAFTLGSCSAIAGIFKAGMGFGIFLVVLLIVVVVAIVMKAGRNK